MRAEVLHRAFYMHHWANEHKRSNGLESLEEMRAQNAALRLSLHLSSVAPYKFTSFDRHIAETDKLIYE